MAIRWRTFTRFSPTFAVCFLLAWNAMMVVGMWLNGGMGRIHSRAALVVVGLAALSVPAILLAAFRSEAIRHVVFRPETNLAEIGDDLTILGLIGGMLGIGVLASAVFQNVP